MRRQQYINSTNYYNSGHPIIMEEQEPYQIKGCRDNNFLAPVVMRQAVFISWRICIGRQPAPNFQWDGAGSVMVGKAMIQGQISNAVFASPSQE